MSAPVVDEAIRKAAVAWVAVGDGPARGVWCMPLEGTLLVVSGPGEQEVPGLAEATAATVRLRGDTGGLIVIWDAAVQRIAPGGEEWQAVAPQLAGKRLNAPGSAEDLAARWSGSGCTIVRLTPAETAVTAPDLPEASGAEAPRDTPARIPTPRPFRLHRVRKPRR